MHLRQSLSYSIGTGWYCSSFTPEGSAAKGTLRDIVPVLRNAEPPVGTDEGAGIPLTSRLGA